MGLIEKLKVLLGKKARPIPDFDDPLSTQISWDPLRSGGTNFCTHRAVSINSRRIEFRKTFLMKIFPWIFISIPFLVFIVFILKNNSDVDLTEIDLDQLIPFSWLLVFIIVGFVFMYIGNKSIVFDKGSGFFWKGKYEPGAVISKEGKGFIELKEIHALQIINERITSSSEGSKSYWSYELNLVLKTGERANVVDHGNAMKLRKDARMIADFLGVPVWDATRIG